jgi:hypothetical protein
MGPGLTYSYDGLNRLASMEEEAVVAEAEGEPGQAPQVTEIRRLPSRSTR